MLFEVGGEGLEGVGHEGCVRVAGAVKFAGADSAVGLESGARGSR